MIKTIILVTLLLSNLLPIIPNSVDHSNLHQFTYINPNAYVTVAIVVKPKNLPLLQMYVENHIILNSTEVYKLFIPEDKIDSIVDYLHKFNLTSQTYLNVILVSGKASEIEKALNGNIYVTEFNSVKFYRFVGNPPTPISNALIIGTNITSAILSKPNTLYNVSQALAYNYFSPQELQRAYNVSWLLERGITGKGTTIGILAFSGDPYIVEQLRSFDKMFNLPDPPFFKIEHIGPYNPNEGIANGWALEISLDVEYAHAMAPEAGIVLYVANLDVPLPAAIAYIVQKNEVDVVSQSFGIPEIYVALGLIPLSFIQALTYEYWLGEVQGITFVAASGDGGGNGYNFYLFPEGSNMLPASNPYVLAVGGTSLYISNDSFAQTAWSGQSVFGASTGGYSVIFPSPWYQGVEGFRRIPDISAVGNPYTGVQVLYYHGEVYLVGGTSLAAPIVAGIISLAVQVHGRLGFINPLIYKLNGTKALVPVEFGYNTPYIANSTPNLVTGLGYINAGYFVKELLYVLAQKSTLSIAVTNSTYIPGQLVKVIVRASSSVPVEGYVYNGTNIVENISFEYNGSYWVGEFIAIGSGVQEAVVRQGDKISGTYFTVGYQAVFILPEVAIYPEPTTNYVLAEILYPNGTAAIAPSNLQAIVYKYFPNNNSFLMRDKVSLSKPLLVQLFRFGVVLFNNGSFVFGSFYNSKDFGGIYMVKINGIFGFTEYVEGAYIIPFIIPPVFSEPTVISPNSNVTVGVAIASLGYPNVTLEFINLNNKVIYGTDINAININNQVFYIKQISLPSNITSGYYYVIAKAKYEGNNYTFTSYGFTQIYVAPYTLKVDILDYPNGGIYQNQSFLLRVAITYPNGTPVKFGTFNAVVVPSFLLREFESLSITFATPLQYYDGYWIANISVPSGITNPFGYSSSGIAGEWYIYIYGISNLGIPTPLVTSLDYNYLAIVPSPSNYTFTLLPYIYTPYFNGTIAYNLYIENATIINHNATFVNSIIKELVAINATVILINSQVIHEKVINAKIIGGNTINQDINTDGANNTNIQFTESYNKGNLTLVVLSLISLFVIFILMVRKIK